MKRRLPARGILGLAGLLAGWLCVANDAETEKPVPAAADPASVELRGKLVPALQPVTNAFFRTTNGEVYTLVSNRLSSALFLDARLQSKTLLLGGRVLPDRKGFEVTRNLRSIREGTVHELFYYCDICAITSTEPGECMCCRQPVRLMEVPEDGSNHRK